MPLRVATVISGGQTGVDQAALRAAASLGISIGGWCPPGRVAENGRIPDIFPLNETPQERSPDALEVPRSQRTEWNVRDSDGTLILRPADFDRDDPGTRWTEHCAARYHKPMIVADPADLSALPHVRQWIEKHCIATLNVAGPSERTRPGIGSAAERFLLDLLSLL
jgi:hypothetical protein